MRRSSRRHSALGQQQEGSLPWPLPPCALSDDAAHGLRHQISHAGHARVGRCAAEAGPADMDLLRRMGKALGGRAPEVGVAGGAGEEDELGAGWGQRISH